ncbi:MAG: ribbon-helix-helix domain-containing protein [Candidatus Bathyarchaeia archaeon]
MLEQISMDAAGLRDREEGEGAFKAGARKARVRFGAVSLPLKILEEIDNLIKDLGYWPSRSAFVREACLEKIKREKERLKEL